MNDISITVDIDWVPDLILEDTINLLSSSGINATFFCTNATDCDFGTHEQAIHPNFVSMDLERHITEMLDLFPEAKGLRSHSLFFSERMRPILSKKEIQYCSNAMLFEHPYLEPCMMAPTVLEFPLYFMDTFNLIMKGSSPTFANDLHKHSIEGMKVYDFHPIHIFMNTYSLEHYDSFKQFYQKPEFLKQHVNVEKYGIRDYLTDLLKHILVNRLSTTTLIDLCAKTRVIADEGNNNR